MNGRFWRHISRYVKVIVGIWVALCESHGQSGIYVFSTSLTKPNVIEKTLSERLQYDQVRVFARFADFQTMVGKDKPAAIICPRLTAEALNLTGGIVLTGIENGKETQPMLWVSLSRVFEAKENPEAQIGLLDVAGRSVMRDLLSKAGGNAMKVKLVSKLEDLLPMLTFKSADAVLIAASDLNEFKARSQADIVSVPSSVQIGSTVVIKQDNQADRWIEAIKKLPKSDLKMLGVDAWK